MRWLLQLQVTLSLSFSLTVQCVAGRQEEPVSSSSSSRSNFASRQSERWKRGERRKGQRNRLWEGCMHLCVSEWRKGEARRRRRKKKNKSVTERVAGSLATSLVIALEMYSILLKSLSRIQSKILWWENVCRVQVKGIGRVGVSDALMHSFEHSYTGIHWLSLSASPPSSSLPLPSLSNVNCDRRVCYCIARCDFSSQLTSYNNTGNTVPLFLSKHGSPLMPFTLLLLFEEKERKVTSNPSFLLLLFFFFFFFFFFFLLLLLLLSLFRFPLLSPLHLPLSAYSFACPFALLVNEDMHLQWASYHLIQWRENKKEREEERKKENCTFGEEERRRNSVQTTDENSGTYQFSSSWNALHHFVLQCQVYV